MIIAIIHAIVVSILMLFIGRLFIETFTGQETIIEIKQIIEQEMTDKKYNIVSFVYTNLLVFNNTILFVTSITILLLLTGPVGWINFINYVLLASSGAMAIFHVIVSEKIIKQLKDIGEI